MHTYIVPEKYFTGHFSAFSATQDGMQYLNEKVIAQAVLVMLSEMVKEKMRLTSVKTSPIKINLCVMMLIGSRT